MPPRKKTNHGKLAGQGITAITVQGFKSIANETTIEIRPLTILAGANSSGKSSIMQPLLMLKQTIESPYDPGPLLIHGSHVKFTSVSQFCSNSVATGLENHIIIKIVYDCSNCVKLDYFGSNENIEVVETTYRHDSSEISLKPNINPDEILKSLSAYNQDLSKNLREFKEKSKLELTAFRNRCFLDVVIGNPKKGILASPPLFFGYFFDLKRVLLNVYHIPGNRGNPERTYNRSAIEREFPGIFTEYVASIISNWQESSNKRLVKLNSYLNLVRLNSNVQSRAINQVQIEILVNRLLVKGTGRKPDLVNIADVGFGVSQTLPVLVALLAAEPGQLVYIEQPELHLHPRAQVAMAQILVDAAKRGVKVVAETHSSSLLLGIQTAVAEGKISPDLVKLHWFERQKNGVTKVTSAELDKHGTFGDWPEDFGDVELKAQSRFLDAAGK